MKSVRLIGFLHPRFIGWLLISAVTAVAIGNPERDMRKASHRGSNQ